MAQVELSPWEVNFLITLIKGSDPMGVYTMPNREQLTAKLMASLQQPHAVQEAERIIEGSES